MLISFQGIGVFDLSKYLQITELRSMKHKVKPLHVVATHTHFDHSGTQNEINQSVFINLHYNL